MTTNLTSPTGAHPPVRAEHMRHVQHTAPDSTALPSSSRAVRS
ncbi:hypothetical protein ACWEQL_00095 [Kitasatospora sp. NPDC004240]